MTEYNVPAEKVFFDSGGGGQEHADRLRSHGHEVQTVAFGGRLNISIATVEPRCTVYYV